MLYNGVMNNNSIKPTCEPEAAAVVTVPTVEGIKGLSNVFVRVLDINSVFFVDSAHRITILSSFPVTVQNYNNLDNPTNFRNQLVFDTATGTLTYFSNKGTAYVLNSGESTIDFNQLINRPKYKGLYMTGSTNIPAVPEELDDLLDGARVTDLETLVTALNEEIDQADDEITAIRDLLNQSVQSDTEVSGDNSTVTLTKTIHNLSSQDTETMAMPLPVASESQAGVMNPATYSAVQTNAENIDALVGGAVVLSDLPEDATQEQLTTAWKEATGRTDIINRASIFDEANKLVWYYYTNISEWKSMPAGDAQVSVSIATNETAGIVKGSDDIAIEPDGSMSVIGLDQINADIANLESKVDNINVPTLPPKIAASLGDFSPILIASQVTINGKAITRLQLKKIISATGEYTTDDLVNLPEATVKYPGLLSPSHFTKLDNLPTITAIGDGLTLGEDGVLSADGGGGSTTLLTNYTASPTEGDVYDAGYVNSRLDGVMVKIGGGATSSSTQAVVIGNNAKATAGDSAIAIGGQNCTASATQAIAIGRAAKGAHHGSVAIGSNSVTTRQLEMSIGAGGTTSTYKTRYLANVTAGELPTDAVNLQQMQDYVAANAGGGATSIRREFLLENNLTTDLNDFCATVVETEDEWRVLLNIAYLPINFSSNDSDNGKDVQGTITLTGAPVGFYSFLGNVTPVALDHGVAPVTMAIYPRTESYPRKFENIKTGVAQLSRSTPSPNLTVRFNYIPDENTDGLVVTPFGQVEFKFLKSWTQV